MSGAVCAANYRNNMKYILLFSIIILINPARAQDKVVITGTVKQDQDLTVVRGQLEDLRAKIAAVEREIARRQNCQRSMQVSTATECVPVPGLKAAILSKLP